MEFISFGKIARFSRDIVVTEKIDGTNAQIAIYHESEITDLADKNILLFHANNTIGGYDVIYAGSRNRWITPQDDNYGFAAWARDNAAELVRLGPGRHFGEWWGKGIQRGYGLNERQFSLFNVHKWGEYGKCSPPDCCSVVPVLYVGPMSETAIEIELATLHGFGSAAAEGYMNPEGIIIYHTASKTYYKKTIKDDSKGKNEA